MNYSRPRTELHWSAKLITAIFLLFVGGLVNQFLNIPAQQAHQDEQISQLRTEMLKISHQVYEVNTPLLNTLNQQHIILMEEQERQSKMLKELTERLDNHDRRSRKR